eukprot:SAG31_NODE_298_length_18125_cov_27.373350_16_plen_69_part_00
MSTAIIGATSQAQLKDNFGALAVKAKLTPELMVSSIHDLAQMKSMSLWCLMAVTIVTVEAFLFNHRQS